VGFAVPAALARSPCIAATWASAVGTESATLEAKLNLRRLALVSLRRHASPEEVATAVTPSRGEA
jgi:hypothetical protein